jgi:hypothetical protein
MAELRRGWVILNYPVVTSRGTDNSGGCAHLLGNLHVYRALGLKTLCLCRLGWPLVDWLDGALCLNIVPGAAVPRQPGPDAPAAASARRGLGRRLRDAALQLVLDALIMLLRPRLLHERANLRFMDRRRRTLFHLVELNDSFVPPQACDAYLTVHERAQLAAPQFIAPWPVPVSAGFDRGQFLDRLRRMGEGPKAVMLFGVGGIADIGGARDFLCAHPWFAGREVKLHVFGAAATDSDGLVFHGWQDEAMIDSSAFDAGLLYYDAAYDDARLALGSPTKLSKYCDWSLPALSNRAVISDRFLGAFDRDTTVLRVAARASDFADFIIAARSRTSVAAYASKLDDFLDCNGLHL